ncbi:MAG: hypothetical protein JOY90_03405 [Bradyrhizobium sp.]|uniref:hypothetical protein n=1 Tax=Bradyrhizobium sp. TaxID=376 RepID=UPI001D89D6C3|nr:hypothetical protein [Bradyrhizobium sp.]MBV9559498.1 hypothetical protein [Bradyrhizobium sp.]
MTGGLLHDFNNLLTVITGTIEILSVAVADRPELHAIAAMIDDAASRGARLTSHLLAFGRGGSVRLCDVDVNTLLAEAAALLRPTLGIGVEVVVVPCSDLPLASTDPDQLMAAVLSLAVAARECDAERWQADLQDRVRAWSR